MTDLSRTFGKQTVDEQERERRIRRVFEAVAARYDLMNDLMSMGIHRLWKRTLVRLAAPAPGQCIVDLAGGTGDVAALMAAPDRQVTVCDPSLAMMEAGRARGHRHVQWLEGTGEHIPLPSASVDTVTIAFGIRNVTRIEDALAEVLRVLKPGGRFLCLEFSPEQVPGLDRLYDLYSFNVIPAIGRAVTGDADAYRYLVESIRRFPRPAAFVEMIRAAGFRRVSVRPMSGGIVALHSGWRL
jgi:demethylmenaquinone methyltransferase/2-methoxy-6-polyprenyl-1,4-benzoquinol methylase